MSSSADKIASAAQRLIVMKRLQEAQDQILAGLDSYPNHIDLLISACKVSDALGDNNRSLCYAQMLVEQHPVYWEGYALRIQQLIQLSQIQSAKAYFIEALRSIDTLKANPINPWTRYCTTALALADAIISGNPRGTTPDDEVIDIISILIARDSRSNPFDSAHPFLRSRFQSAIISKDHADSQRFYIEQALNRIAITKGLHLGAEAMMWQCDIHVDSISMLTDVGWILNNVATNSLQYYFSRDFHYLNNQKLYNFLDSYYSKTAHDERHSDHFKRNLDMINAINSSSYSKRRLTVDTSSIPTSPPRSLSIALCISGQLRGYKQAYPSVVKAFGLEQHNTDVFVHVWESIGKKELVPHQAKKLLTGQMLELYQQLAIKDRNFNNIFASMYPMLYSLICNRGGEGIAKRDELINFYHARDVVIEDDRSDRFTTFTNPMKMYYKVERCFELAASSGKAYDIVIRIRPDRSALESEILDLAGICAMLHDGLIYADDDFHFSPFGGLCIGDQFAIGSWNAMAKYSCVYSDGPNAPYLSRPGYRPHGNFAEKLMYNNIDVQKGQGIRLGPLLNPGNPNSIELLLAFMLDINDCPSSDLDFLFLKALSQDARQLQSSVPL